MAIWIYLLDAQPRGSACAGSQVPVCNYRHPKLPAGLSQSSKWRIQGSSHLPCQLYSPPNPHPKVQSLWVLSFSCLLLLWHQWEWEPLSCGHCRSPLGKTP